MTTRQSGPFRRSPLIPLWILCALRAGAVGSTIALGSLVETELNAFCRGLPRECVGGGIRSRPAVKACVHALAARKQAEREGTNPA